MAMSMEFEIEVKVIGLRCVLTQDVKGMLYAKFDGVRHYS